MSEIKRKHKKKPCGEINGKVEMTNYVLLETKLYAADDVFSENFILN